MRTNFLLALILSTPLLLAGCGGAESSGASLPGSNGGATGGGSVGGGGAGGGESSGGGSSGGGTGTSLPGASTPPPDCTTNCGFTGLLSDKDLHTPPAVATPALHASYVDATFGTTVYRLTAASQISGVSRVRHYYSKQNPFNADETYAMMTTSDGHYWVYDAATYEPIKRVSGYPDFYSSEPEIQWHPTNPDWFYFINYGDEFSRFEISSHTVTVMHDFENDGFSSVGGRLEGNMDASGQYYAMVGQSTAGHEAFVYDVVNDQISARVNISSIANAGFDWISITPNGEFVVLMASDRSYVYDLNMNYLGSLPLGSFGHADLCSLADGRQVMVYDGADHVVAADGGRWINMAYLDTVDGASSGTVVPVVKIDWTATPHVSCRNTQFPGWSLISTRGDGSHVMDMEIFWVKLDGSGEVRHVAHHYSNRDSGGYFAEQHAVTNKYGTKVIFASNYGSGEIADYLVDLRDFRTPSVE